MKKKILEGAGMFFLGNWQLRTTYYVCSDRILPAL